MNIFVLDKDPYMASVYHLDKHVVKMPLETAQMLCTALQHKGIKKDWMYKEAHKNHPCTIWAREPRNFNWLCLLGIELCREYTYRYGKIHKCQDIIEKCYEYVTDERDPLNWALAMPDYCKISANSVECYREYYIKEKYYIATWEGKINSRKAPYWFTYMSSSKTAWEKFKQNKAELLLELDFD